MRKTLQELENEFATLDHSDCGPGCPYAVGLSSAEKIQQAHILLAKAIALREASPTWADLNYIGRIRDDSEAITDLDNGRPFRGGAG